eukprot:CAMPEP_0202969002 /NCGR_PEP_ID=MMETSP1396-20130829/14583_1 /ASSEMBLY_ACC=CAM_ASM_000872 /TAXON_ID= /ORGANISM="Pseudokeronopsis sp., Strain Brazil" /LENGTH=65 /DNA_ID=CAMNT_0049696043 /DNA_START=820 /DNA_END=1018 /DNA_ORIENTATION=+
MTWRTLSQIEFRDLANEELLLFGPTIAVQRGNALFQKEAFDQWVLGKLDEERGKETSFKQIWKYE